MQMIRKIFVFWGIFLLMANLCFAQIENNHLNQLITALLKHNPQINTAREKYQAAEHKVKFIKKLPNPIFQYGYFFENIETRVGPQQHKFGLFQKIPFPGKLATKAEIQARQVDILEQKYKQTKLQVIKQLKYAYYDIFYIDKAIENTQEEKSILESIESIARKKYESNLIRQQDVIRTHVALSNLTAKLLSLKQKRESLLTRLNTLVSTPDKISISKVQDIIPTYIAYDISALKKIALTKSPDIILAEFEIEKSIQAVKFAKKIIYPILLWEQIIYKQENEIFRCPKTAKTQLWEF
jgi:outer membrane protein TolC